MLNVIIFHVIMLKVVTPSVVASTVVITSGLQKSLCVCVSVCVCIHALFIFETVAMQFLFANLFQRIFL